MLARKNLGAPSPMYSNPILDEDWPDPDVIRVGIDYYLVASSFNRSPGLPVLHSRDLVNWSLISCALGRVAPDEYGLLPRHGGGVWAPSIRFHRGLFYIVYPDPDRGIYVVTAKDPSGPWSSPRLLLQGLGLIDPCPLWSSDGRTWLVHGWAKSRAGMKNRLSVLPVDGELMAPLGSDQVVVDGADFGLDTLEGPKFYERDGWYWILAPAGGVSTGYQCALRSRDPRGPYECRVVLRQGATAVNGPHQGAWVDTPDGTDWFLHFQDRGPFGRVLHLQPMEWRDGWPVVGLPVPGEHWGEPVHEHETPLGTAVMRRSLSVSEPLQETPSLPGPLPLKSPWRWQADVVDGCRLSGGRLQVDGPGLDIGNLRTLPSVLGQPLSGLGIRMSTTVSLTGPAGSRGGVGVLGYDYGWLGLVQCEHEQQVVYATRSDGDGQETIHRSVRVPNGVTVDLQVEVSPEAQARFVARVGDVSIDSGCSFRVREGHWIGAELVMFCAAPLGEPSAAASFGPISMNSLESSDRRG